MQPKNAKSRRKALHDFSLHLYMKLRFVTTFLGDIEMVTNILQWLKKQDNEERENNYISFQSGDFFCLFPSPEIYLRLLFVLPFGWSFSCFSPSTPEQHRLVSFLLFLYQHDLSHHVISLLEYVVATNVYWLRSFSRFSFIASISIDRWKEPRNRKLNHVSYRFHFKVNKLKLLTLVAIEIACRMLWTFSRSFFH